MVFALHAKTTIFHDVNHFITDIHLRVLRGNWEIAFLVADFVTEVRELFAPTVPDAFVGIEIVEAAVRRLTKPNIIENKEFRFRTEIRCVSQTGALEECFSFASDISWVATVRFVRDCVERIRDDAQRCRLRKWINNGGVGIQLQQHVAGFNGFPAADRGAVKPQAFGENFLGQFGNRDAEMLPRAQKIAKLDVH